MGDLLTNGWFLAALGLAALVVAFVFGVRLCAESGTAIAPTCQTMNATVTSFWASIVQLANSLLTPR